MCRLFGFASSHPSRLHFALATAPNSLERQSVRHKDGWGVGFYVDGEAVVRKRTEPAFADAGFDHAAADVESTHVVAHVRKATVGGRTILNNHPFRVGPWIFAHNGTVERFHAMRDDLLALVPRELLAHRHGETDSEMLFLLTLSLIHKAHGTLDVAAEDAAPQVVEAIRVIDTLDAKHGAERASRLNLLLTNGRGLLATRRGKELFIYPWDSPEVPTVTRWLTSTGAIGLGVPQPGARSVILSSERVANAPGWEEVPEDSLVLVGRDLHHTVTSLEKAA